MQLWEEGLVDLDAPANDYLRAYRLVPARTSFRPATLRHLLTHTAGIPDVVHVSDLLHPAGVHSAPGPPISAWQSASGCRRSPSTTAAVFGWRSSPATAFRTRNHGFATLGQIVEDVSGIPRERYFRERLFEPLGMTDRPTSSAPSGSPRTWRPDTSSGDAVRQPVADREWICRLGAGGIYSTSRDMARFVAALLGGGANEHGRVLEPSTLATMFEPHYRPDPRLPGRGLGFVPRRRRRASARRPRRGAAGLQRGAAGCAGRRCRRLRLDEWLERRASSGWRSSSSACCASCSACRTMRSGRDVPHHPEVWAELCGRYDLPARSPTPRAPCVGGWSRGRSSAAGG